MKAYKIWNDEKNFIHKDTTNELDVSWTTDIKEALDTDVMYNGLGLPPFSKAARFFHDELGFSLNISKYDALYYI